MRTRSLALRLLATAMVAALAGCSSSHPDDDSNAIVDELPEGRYVVALGDPANPTIGKYVSAANGTRWLVVLDANDRATQLYRRDDDGDGWDAVPPLAAGTTVRLLSSMPMSPRSGAVTATELAGNYVTRLPDGSAARFTVAASGDISASGTGCQLTGNLRRSSMPMTLSARLQSAGCGNWPARSEGIVIVDSDDRPARFRIVADDDRRVVDLWAFQQ